MSDKTIKMHPRYFKQLAKNLFKSGYWFFNFHHTIDENTEYYVRAFKILDSDLDSQAYKNFVKKYILE